MNRLRTGVIVFLALGGIAAALILYFSGYLTRDRIQPDERVVYQDRLPEPARTAQAAQVTVTEWFEAVGTVRPRTETTIEAQITGRVLEVLAVPGRQVSPGDKLIVLDSRELKARHERALEALNLARARWRQAEQAVVAATAEFVKAKADFDRFTELYSTMAATIRERDQAKASFLAAEAGLKESHQGLDGAEAAVNQAAKVVEEAEISLSYTVIKALESAQVVKKMVEPGDLAWPGKQLLVLQTSEALRLEALVREGLIDRVRPGVELPVVIDAVNMTVPGLVEEVVPAADPQTRTFLVKVLVKPEAGLLPGMFGRLKVPLEKRRVVVVSERAVRRVGQLELVRVKKDGRWQDFYVRTGRRMDGRVEVLSGLEGTETVAMFDQD